MLNGDGRAPVVFQLGNASLALLVDVAVVDLSVKLNLERQPQDESGAHNAIKQYLRGGEGEVLGELHRQKEGSVLVRGTRLQNEARDPNKREQTNALTSPAMVTCHLKRSSPTI